MYPLLWLVPYCAILYLVFRRSLYSVSIPILIFSLLYLYFMGKGYLGPYFARITMVLFPGFCVLLGIAEHKIRSEEHTSELQSLRHLVCRLLLEKKNYMGRTLR